MDYGSRPGQEVLGAITDRQVAGLRLFLSIAAFFAVYIDPPDPEHFVSLTYFAVVAYTLYSVCIYGLARPVEAFPRSLTTLLVWTDVFTYSALIYITSGTNSIFFFFYFFVIAVASSRLGPESAVAVTLVSTAAFLTIVYFGARPMPEWNRVMLRASSLLALGYVLVYWSNAELRLRQKLELLREVCQTSNPRFGVERTCSQLMKRLREFFKADSCVLLEYQPESDAYQVRCSTARNFSANDDVLPQPCPLQDILKDLSPTGASFYSESGGILRGRSYRIWSPESQATVSQSPDDARSVADWLGCRTFVAVPLRQHEWFKGYLVLTSNRANAFRIEDSKFLLHLANEITAVLEHIRLVDRMASDSAEEERRRIARSVHDRVVQPYIGLQAGLVGVRDLVESVVEQSANNGLTKKRMQALAALDHLVDMAREGIDELRQYVYGLRNEKTSSNTLVEALQRYGVRFESVLGIRIRVHNRLEAGQMNDRLAAEIFQMTTEALSNVRRHTTATSVDLFIESDANGKVVVGIENETTGRATAFIPKSITERSQSLGGQTQVSTEEGLTVVRIEIPL